MPTVVPGPHVSQPIADMSHKKPPPKSSQGMSSHPHPAVTSHPVLCGASTATAPVGAQWGCHTRLGATAHFGRGWAWGHPWSPSVSMATGPGGRQGHWAGRGQRGHPTLPRAMGIIPHCPPAECPQGCPHTCTHTGLCHQVSPGMSPLRAECHQWLKGPVWPPVLRGAVVWVALQSHPMQGDVPRATGRG